jgi:lipopolysaccharide-induced tumor necrosis factor-alpha factor
MQKIEIENKLKRVTWSCCHVHCSNMTEASELNRIENGTADGTTSVPLVVEYPEVKLKVSEVPVIASCPYCHGSMITEIEAKPGPFTLITAIILAHCFLCWIPFIVERFQDMKHSCPRCKSTIGIFKRM